MGFAETRFLQRADQQPSFADQADKLRIVRLSNYRSSGPSFSLERPRRFSNNQAYWEGESLKNL